MSYTSFTPATLSAATTVAARSYVKATREAARDAYGTFIAVAAIQLHFGEATGGLKADIIQGINDALKAAGIDDKGERSRMSNAAYNCAHKIIRKYPDVGFVAAARRANTIEDVRSNLMQLMASRKVYAASHMIIWGNDPYMDYFVKPEPAKAATNNAPKTKAEKVNDAIGNLKNAVNARNNERKQEQRTAEQIQQDERATYHANLVSALAFISTLEPADLERVKEALAAREASLAEVSAAASPETAAPALDVENDVSEPETVKARKPRKPRKVVETAKAA